MGPAMAWSDNEVVVVRPPNTNEVLSGSSAFHRMDKKFNLNWQLLGIGPLSYPSSGLAAGYFLDLSSLVQIEVSNGSNTILGVFTTRELDANSVGIHYKKFAGNSFYWKLGGDYTQARSKEKFSFLGTESVQEIKGNVTSASIVIGNQWQWETFTLGCDWFGYSAPLFHTVTQRDIASNDPSRERYADEEETRLFKRNGIHLLRFYIGASF